MNEEFNPSDLDNIYNKAMSQMDEENSQEEDIADPYKEFANEDFENDEEEYANTYEDFSSNPVEETSQMGHEFDDYYSQKENPTNGIYPNGMGPTETQVALFKKKFASCTVFVAELAGEYFTCRTITRAEYKNLTAMPIDQLQREENICLKCVLNPVLDWTSLVSLRAGIISTLASIIMEQSGFTDNYGVKIL